MQKPKAVVFDMDGLMFNTEDVYTLVGTELLQRRGHAFEKDLKDAMMGLPPRQAFEVMIEWHKLGETWEQLAAESNKLFVALLEGNLAPLPGLFELLEALETAAVPKAIATSSDRRLVEACLSPFQLQERFQFVLTAADVARGKPHPDIYVAAAEHFGVVPEETLVLEDSRNGCLAAAAAGAFTVAVPGEHSKSHDFSVASLVVESLADSRLFAAL